MSRALPKRVENLDVGSQGPMAFGWAGLKHRPPDRLSRSFTVIARADARPDDLVPPESGNAALDLEGTLTAGLLAIDPPLVYATASQVVEPIDFYGGAYAALWRAASDLLSEGAVLSGPLIVARARTSRGWEKSFEARVAEAARRTEAVPPEGWRAIAERVAQFAAERTLRGQIQAVHSMLGHAPPEKVQERLDEAAASLRARIGKGARHASVRFATVAEILATPDDGGASHLWHGVVAPGCVTLVAGFPKAGKSSLLYAFAAEVARGGTWAGKPVAKTRVVILSEESRRTLARIVRRFGLEEGVEIVSRGDVSPGTPWPEVVRQVQLRMETTGAGLLIVDTFSHWADLPPDAEKDEGPVRRALRPLQDLAATGPAVVVAHHLRKGDGDFGEAIRGSSALNQVPDALVEVRFFRGEESSERAVKSWGRLADGRSETIVRFVPGDDGVLGRYEFLGTAEHARKGLADDRVLAALAGLARWATAAEVHEASGVKRTGVESSLPRLHRGGRIQRRGTGKRGAAYVYAALGVPLEAAAVGSDRAGE